MGKVFGILKGIFGICLILWNLERLKIKDFWEFVWDVHNLIFGRIGSIFGIWGEVFGSEFIIGRKKTTRLFLSAKNRQRSAKNLAFWQNQECFWHLRRGFWQIF